MLKVFRDNLKNLAWILWVVIAVFVLTLAVDFGSGLNPGGAQATAAKVGDETVSLAEFQSEYRQLSNLYRQVYGDQLTPELMNQMQLPRQALDQAVNQKILLAEARRMGLAVTDAELRDRILKEQVFQDEQGNFVGEERYKQILQANQLSTAAFEEEVRRELLLKKLTDALSANLYVSNEEVERAYREQVERAKIRYLQLPRDRFVQEVQVQPAELQAWFDAHKQEYRLPEQRDIAYLLASGQQLASQVTLADKELRDWYEANKNQFTQEEQVRARHVLVMVNDQRNDEQAQARIAQAKARLTGGDFAAVAKEFSDDTASKDTGGDLGYFGRGRMVKEFEEAAFGAQQGQIVGPVKSSFGYHLIEVTDKRAGGTQPFEAVKEQIRARLAAERAQQLAETKAREIASQLAKDKPANAEALRAVSQKNPGVTFAETGKITAQSPVPGIGLGGDFSKSAFALKKGEVSEAVQVPSGWAVLYVKDVFEPRTPALAEVQQRVQAAVTAQKLQEITMRRLTEARRQIDQGKTLDQVAAELGLQVRETEEFGGQGGSIPGLGYSPELAKAALALQKGKIGGPVADGQGGVLFQVTDRKGWDPKQFASNREQTRTGLLQQKLSRLQSALVEKRRRELGVEYDRQFLDQFGIPVPEQS